MYGNYWWVIQFEHGSDDRSVAATPAVLTHTHTDNWNRPEAYTKYIYIERFTKNLTKLILVFDFSFFLWIETMINLSIHHFRIDLLFIGIDDIDMKIRSNNNKLISHFEMLAPDSLTLSRAYDILIAISINMYSVWFETINTCNDGSIFGASNFSRCFSFMALECRQKKKSV